MAGAGDVDPVPGAPVELKTDGGTIRLFPAAAADFKGQPDNTRIRTRLGTTVHSSGSQFLAGSSLSLGTMRGTKQYKGSPMIAFRYETTMDEDAAAAALSAIGSASALVLDSGEYSPFLVWVGDRMGCFFYKCDALPETEPAFGIRNGKLLVKP